MKWKWLLVLGAIFTLSSFGMLMAQESTPETVSPAVPSQPSLVGSTWQWEHYADGAEAFDVTSPENYTVTFNADGSVNIQADCNSVLGQYTAGDDGTISIVLGPSTLMACPEGSHDQVFTITLSQVTLYSFTEDGMLLLEAPADSGSLAFSAQSAATPTLVGPTWQWQHFASGAEAYDVPEPQNYTITFNEDGTVNILADCNNVLGQYTADAEGAISIVLGPTTLMACPEGSLDQNFTIALSQVTLYAFTEDGMLLLEAPADSGSLAFSAQSAQDNIEGTLTGVTWQWQEFISRVEAFIVFDPQDYTITFNEDGSVFARADCNNVIGQYTLGDEAGQITIMLGAMTMMACPPGSLQQNFVAALSNVTVYSFTDDGKLFLEGSPDSGSLILSAQPQVTGVLTYLQRIALPEDAFIRVQIEDVSLMDVPSVVIGEQIIEPAGAQVPIPFAVSYSENDIQEGHRYSLSARITDGNGNLLWITDSFIPVITDGSPTSDIEVTLVQVSS